MAADPIVIAIDVIERVCAGLGGRGEKRHVEFRLETREKALGLGVVAAVAFALKTGSGMQFSTGLEYRMSDPQRPLFKVEELLSEQGVLAFSTMGLIKISIVKLWS